MDFGTFVIVFFSICAVIFTLITIYCACFCTLRSKTLTPLRSPLTRINYALETTRKQDINPYTENEENRYSHETNTGSNTNQSDLNVDVVNEETTNSPNPAINAESPYSQTEMNESAPKTGDSNKADVVHKNLI